MDILENMRKMLEAGKISKEDIERAFPELKESEDERIKNLIYCIVRDRSDVGKLLEANGCPVQKALSYLEKHEEQKPIQTPQWMIDFLNEHRRHFASPMDYEERKEVDGKLLCIKEWLEGNPNIEQHPAKWSDEDEMAIKSLISYFESKTEEEINSAKKTVEWLKSLHPQPKQEWSEEEKALDMVIDFMENEAEFHTYCGYEREYLIRLLKSLRPQPHWKPSEEQMEALFLVSGVGAPKHRETLKSLYNDLKKLI